ncbi:hypothetical protein ACGF12_34795 [Kitasatospora sp. NPDC048296]|uniref:hypothetical protein n=1 Tax=Kitasatospora sp. NPDC048296 TaxID=3364048 RepID=UPI003718B47E
MIERIHEEAAQGKSQRRITLGLRSAGRRRCSVKPSRDGAGPAHHGLARVPSVRYEATVLVAAINEWL